MNKIVLGGRLGAMMLKTRHYKTNVIKILFSYIIEVFERDALTMRAWAFSNDMRYEWGASFASDGSTQLHLLF